MKYLISYLLTALVISGCSTIDSLQPGTGGTVFKIQGKSYNEIWQAAAKVVSKNFAIIESNKKLGSLKAEKRAGIATLGEVVGVFIRPAKGAKVYSVEVQSLKRSKIQITGQDWTETIILGIKVELGI